MPWGSTCLGAPLALGLTLPLLANEKRVKVRVMCVCVIMVLGGGAGEGGRGGEGGLAEHTSQSEYRKSRAFECEIARATG